HSPFVCNRETSPQIVTLSYTTLFRSLINIDDVLARTVAEGLGLRDIPEPADAAVAPRNDLAPSPALSIIENGPDSFAGRKLGVRSEEHTSELQSREKLVCRLRPEKKK